MEYIVHTEQDVRLDRSVLMDGVFIHVQIHGTEGLVSTDDGEQTLTDEQRSRVASHYNLTFDEEAEDTEQKDTEQKDTEEEEEEEEDDDDEDDEDENDNITAEELEALHEERGSWSAVGDYLDMSDYKLRKLRKELGI